MVGSRQSTQGMHLRRGITAMVGCYRIYWDILAWARRENSPIKRLRWTSKITQPHTIPYPHQIRLRTMYIYVRYFNDICMHETWFRGTPLREWQIYWQLRKYLPSIERYGGYGNIIFINYPVLREWRVAWQMRNYPCINQNCKVGVRNSLYTNTHDVDLHQVCLRHLKYTWAISDLNLSPLLQTISLGSLTPTPRGHHSLRKWSLLCGMSGRQKESRWKHHSGHFAQGEINTLS